MRGVVVSVFLAYSCWWCVLSQDSQVDFVVALVDERIGVRRTYLYLYAFAGVDAVAVSVNDEREISAEPYDTTYDDLSGSQKSKKSVSVVINNRYASILFADRYMFFAFSPLPVSALGRRYIISSCYSTESYLSYVLVIAAHSFRTDVNITFHTQDSVTYDTNIYNDGDTLSLTLEQYQTFTLHTDADLTGTVITSEQTIAVFSGVVRSYVVAYDQLLPVHHYGQEYVVAVDDESDYTLQILSEHNDNLIVFNDGSTEHVDNSGIYRQNVSSNDSLHFTSSRPVMTTLCRIDRYYCTLCTVPPVDKYTAHTAFYDFGSDFRILTSRDAVISVINSTSSIEAESWEEIPGSDYKIGTWSGRNKAFDISSNATFTVMGYRGGLYNVGRSFEPKSASCTCAPPTVEAQITGEETSKLVVVSVVCSVIIVALLAVIASLVWRLYRSSKHDSPEDNTDSHYTHVEPRSTDNSRMYGHIENTTKQDNPAYSPDEDDDNDLGTQQHYRNIGDVELKVQNNTQRSDDVDAENNTVQYECIDKM